MILAHLSDLHLGFRAYGRVERGTDMRERDVAAAFERAAQELVKAAPDVVVVAGDVFDRPDPPAGALVALSRGLELLRASLPRTPVLMVAGPRDTPRRPGDPGALAVMDTFPNVEAATALARSITIERLDLHACLVPYRSALREPMAPTEPDPRVRWNVLVVHGRIAARGERGVAVDPRDWSYVALGGEHRHTKLGPNVQYPGSLERVALDPWAEAADEKGFLLVDLERRDSLFHSIPGRAVVALAPIRVAPGDPDRLRRRVREVMGEVPGGIDGKIVRLRLDGVEPEALVALQGEQLESLRQRALHLMVEAGGEPSLPQDARVPPDSPRLLREALEAELARVRVDGAAVAELVHTLMPKDFAAESSVPPIGVVDALEGEVPGVGRVSTSVLPGLTAVIGGAGRARRAVATLLIRTARTPESPQALEGIWAGWGGETLDGALHQAVEAVASVRGVGVVDGALERIASLEDVPAPVGGHADAEGRGGAKRVDGEQVAAELRSAERELRTLRADAAELAGDLEVATMDWLRERQDAETTLTAYRDRARELRGRIRRLEDAGPDAPCPTCGRVLESHHEEVLRELREDWEGLVQDGSWWRRRWEQLEPKPEHLRELEGRSLRLHAALDGSSERVELLRARLGELEGAAAEEPPPSSRRRSGGAVEAALQRLREARVTRARDLLLARASRYLGRISGGRILAITWRDGAAQLQGDAGPLAPLSEEDLAAGRLALRLGAASLVAAGGQVLASLVVEEPFDRLETEARLRALVLLRDLLQAIPRIVLFTRGEAVDARPEVFDAVFELRDDVLGGASALRPAHAGAGRILLREPARPTRLHAPQR